MMTALLSVTGLSVSYGHVRAVNDISLVVEQGEAVTIVGPNGAGKSSTLKAIAGQVAASAGTVELDGQQLLGLAPERVARRGVAIVPEGRHIFASLTVEENLKLAASAHRRRLAQRHFDEIFERFPGLLPLRHARGGNLSGGEQQQLAIARALVTQPRLLLLDEPSLGLSPVLVNVVFDTLRELRDEGTTVLLVEQNARKAIAFAERTYVMRTGSVLLEGERDELLRNRATAEAAYLR